jgi:hypothetical protein
MHASALWVWFLPVTKSVITDFRLRLPLLPARHQVSPAPSVVGGEEGQGRRSAPKGCEAAFGTGAKQA